MRLPRKGSEKEPKRNRLDQRTAVNRVKLMAMSSMVAVVVGMVARQRRGCWQRGRKWAACGRGGERLLLWRWQTCLSLLVVVVVVSCDITTFRGTSEGYSL